jgi:hypothetical protein
MNIAKTQGAAMDDDSGKGNAMTEVEAMAELERLDSEFAAMTNDEHRHFESLLYLRAMVRGWTGDPLCQPASSVLAAYRQLRAERGASE